MNSFLLKRKQLKEVEVRKIWNSYVKFLGILMVKKPTDKKYKVFDCDSRNFVVRLRYTYTVLLRKILVGLGMLYVSQEYAASLHNTCVCLSFFHAGVLNKGGNFACYILIALLQSHHSQDLEKQHLKRQGFYQSLVQAVFEYS